MQYTFHESAKCKVRHDTVVANGGQFVVWHRLVSFAQHVTGRSQLVLRDLRKRKWIWATVVGLLSLHSYFVRELLSAFFFFTILYVVLAIMVALYILVVDALDFGSVWLESLSRACLSPVRHYFALPAQLSNPTSERALHRIRKLGDDQILASKRRTS